jgi:hypothetical protein
MQGGAVCQYTLVIGMKLLSHNTGKQIKIGSAACGLALDTEDLLEA